MHLGKGKKIWKFPHFVFYFLNPIYVTKVVLTPQKPFEVFPYLKWNWNGNETFPWYGHSVRLFLLRCLCRAVILLASVTTFGHHITELFEIQLLVPGLIKSFESCFNLLIKMLIILPSPQLLYLCLVKIFANLSEFLKYIKIR